MRYEVLSCDLTDNGFVVQVRPTIVSERRERAVVTIEGDRISLMGACDTLTVEQARHLGKLLIARADELAPATSVEAA